MSYYQRGGMHRGKPLPTASKGVKSKKQTKSKIRPAWDDSLTNNEEYRASLDDIERRKVAHLSSNLEVVRAEKLGKKIARAKRREKAPNSQRINQSAFLKEVLYNQDQMKDVLKRSDKVLAVVKDLFGDDPKKFRGLPNVTVAPDKMGTDSILPDGRTVDDRSKMDILSESVMDKTALNDFLLDNSSNGENEDTSDEDENEELSYQPIMDFSRFKQFIQKEQEKSNKEARKEMSKIKIPRGMAPKELEDLLKNARKVQGEIQDSKVEEDSPSGSPKVLAINDTSKVKKTQARVNTSVSPDGQDELDEEVSKKDLLIVLDGHGPEPSYKTSIQPASLSSLPTSDKMANHQELLVSVNRLTSVLHESEIRIKAETLLREQLSQDVSQLKALIDGLTADIIGSQEEYAILKTQFMKYQQKTDAEITFLKRGLLQLIQKQSKSDESLASFVHVDQQSQISDATNMGDLEAQLTYALQTANKQLTSSTYSDASKHPKASKPAPSRLVQGNVPELDNLHNTRDNLSYSIRSQESLPMSIGSLNGALPQSRVTAQGIPYSQVQKELVVPFSGNGIHDQNEQFSRASTSVLSNQPFQRALNDKIGHCPENAEMMGTVQQSLQSPRSLMLEMHNGASLILNTNRGQGDGYQAAKMLAAPVQRDSPRASNKTSSLFGSQDERIPSSHLAPQQLFPMGQATEHASLLENLPLNEDGQLLEQQIAELNRQHNEAQSKLKALMDQQKQINKFELEENQKGSSSVSPPLSPIPVESESGGTVVSSQIAGSIPVTSQIGQWPPPVPQSLLDRAQQQSKENEGQMHLISSQGALLQNPFTALAMTQKHMPPRPAQTDHLQQNIIESPLTQQMSFPHHAVAEMMKPQKQGREITVSLPRVEHLELSGTMSPSPQSSRSKGDHG